VAAGGVPGAGGAGLPRQAARCSRAQLRLPPAPAGHLTSSPLPGLPAPLQARQLLDRKAVERGAQPTYYPILLNSSGMMVGGAGLPLPGTPPRPAPAPAAQPRRHPLPAAQLGARCFARAASTCLSVSAHLLHPSTAHQPTSLARHPAPPARHLRRLLLVLPVPQGAGGGGPVRRRSTAVRLPGHAARAAGVRAAGVCHGVHHPRGPGVRRGRVHEPGARPGLGAREAACWGRGAGGRGCLPGLLQGAGGGLQRLSLCLGAPLWTQAHALPTQAPGLP
jgi:hypothetical protein